MNEEHPIKPFALGELDPGPDKMIIMSRIKREYGVGDRLPYSERCTSTFRVIRTRPNGERYSEYASVPVPQNHEDMRSESSSESSEEEVVV